MGGPRRPLAPVLGLSLLLALTPAAVAGAPERELRSALERSMSAAGSHSGAYVTNLTGGRRLYGERANRRRSLASNTKLFTTATALDRLGTGRRLATEVVGDGSQTNAGVWRGDLHLVGGGDPTFGSESFATRYGSEASVDALAAQVEEAGVTRVTGRVRGDESRYDSLRGGPASGYGASVFVGPLSALSFDRGVGGGGFVGDPPRFAAQELTRALERLGIAVAKRPREGVAPGGATPLARVQSPTMASLAAATNKPSDNFFAEMLAKEVATSDRIPGSTDRGARLARRFAAQVGASARLVDGSGLSSRNRAAPRSVVTLLSALARREAFASEFLAFDRSLPVAGRDGTLAARMQGEAAEGRCRAKTGTLSGVSTLSGYCDARGGSLLAFSFLMNRIDVTRARELQDRMANAVARYRG